MVLFLIRSTPITHALHCVRWDIKDSGVHKHRPGEESEALWK